MSLLQQTFAKDPNADYTFNIIWFRRSAYYIGFLVLVTDRICGKIARIFIVGHFFCVPKTRQPNPSAKENEQQYTNLTACTNP